MTKLARPADTALTRMYNRSCIYVPTLTIRAYHHRRNRPDKRSTVQQPIRLSLEDFQNRGCQGMVQRWVTDQSRGLLAGTTAHFLRIAPHTVITLVANEVSSLLLAHPSLTPQLIMSQYKAIKAKRQ